MGSVCSLKAWLAASMLAIPTLAWAANEPDPSLLSLGSTDTSQATAANSANPSASPAASLNPQNLALTSLPSSATTVTYMDAAPAAEQPNIHGFIEYPFKTAYITPRGLVVENKGLVMQPVGGFVLPIGDIGPVKGFTLVTGVWNSINTAQHDPFVGTWNELDYFATASGNIGKFSVAFTYSPWNSPPHAFTTEENIDIKVQYDDTGMLLPGFAFKPYVDWFWAVAGDSPVINGRSSTFYFEVGVQPTYTLKYFNDYPITFTVPTYVEVGEPKFWGADTNAETKSDGPVGDFSIALNGSVPLPFIPAKYGFWHADAGIQFFWLVNDALLRAGGLASGNTDRTPVNASVGIGVNF
jgi:hypothetical protein